jgi:hypothetical protein
MLGERCLRGWLIRVGIDSKNMGYCAPVFPDGTFEFIPLPAFGRTDETKTYGTMEARNKRYGEHLSDFIHTDPRELYDGKGNLVISSYDFENGELLSPKDIPMHYDPEFETSTFGDQWMGAGQDNRGRIPSDLHPGNYVFFYSGLMKYDPAFYQSERKWDSFREFRRYNMCTYIIGYLKVRDIISIETVEDLHSRPEMTNNAHVKEEIIPSVILIGDESRLLTKAIPMNSWDDKTRKYVPTKLGMNILHLQPLSGVRVWKWLEEPDCEAVLELIHENQ